MSLLQVETIRHTDPSETVYAPAVLGLHAAFEAQRRAFAADRQPNLAARRDRLQRIVSMMEAYRERIILALNADFGAHPAPLAEVLEITAVTARAEYALAHLEEWMQPMSDEVDPAYQNVLRALIKSQPKGVVGNIAPWNFPFEIGIGPAVDMLAAGNRVMLKPSEFAPACATLMREMVSATFPADLVYVAVGGLELARAFTALPFDHLLYTGSSDVGRQVMTAAAQNLTPITLELGGKCPAVLLSGSVTPDWVGNILAVKMIKNGQMCVTVDHCFVPRADLDRFASIASEFMAQTAPAYARSAGCTGIISERHLNRMIELLAEAKARGVRIVTLEDNGEIDHESRRMPVSLVLDPPLDLRIMREEIFGPILPVIPYDDVDEVIERINASDSPLGVYVFGDDVQSIDHILEQTVSGGAAVNACAIQAGLKALAFGGVGASGMGRHHGEAGFREFSNQRGIVVRGTGPHFDAFLSRSESAKNLVG
jgi:coniferyl-aldehyde dehydrogenase